MATNTTNSTTDTRFKGIPYPLTKTPGGYFPVQSGTNQIKSDMLCLLLTYPGERVYLPQFGTPLADLIYEPSDAITVNKAIAMIQQSLTLWEPRVEIKQVNVFIGTDAQSQSSSVTNDVNKILTISIQFIDPQQIQKVEQLDVQVPLTFGTNVQPNIGGLA